MTHADMTHADPSTAPTSAIGRPLAAWRLIKDRVVAEIAAARREKKLRVAGNLAERAIFALATAGGLTMALASLWSYFVT